MASSAVIQRLEQRAQMADELIVKLKQQVGELKQCADGQEARQLTAENTQLTQEVERLKKKLIQLEISNGIKQVPLPASIVNASTNNQHPPVEPPKTNAAPAPTPAEGKPKKENKKEKKKDAANKKEKKEGKNQPQAPAEVDVTNLDLRIGRMVDVKKHPDADSLYIETVDCGEESPRTVVSGLVKHVPIEQMQDKIAIFCCNLKPSKMRGVVSQAMVMCASSPEKIEILNPPAGAVIGDRISFQGYEMSETFPPQMNPKRKIFERIAPDLKVNDKGVATYKGVPFEIQGKGICTAPTMTNSIIK